jgi:DNA-binding transcriptional LysR family regulator
MQSSRIGNIWEGVEALAALERAGTVSEAATRLRLTQSAVSKRLQALARAVRFPVVARSGRRVVLTARGLELLERSRPLLAGLRELAAPGIAEPVAPLSLAIADSIAASWGPRIVAAALARLPGLALELHAHRTPLLVEQVRLGRYQIGLATGGAADPELVQHPLADEPLVLLRAGSARRDLPLVTIEPRSATWRAIEPALRRDHPALLARRRTPVESFAAAVQLVRAGFGDGLVPLGLVRELALPPPTWRRLRGLTRPIVLVTRKSIHHLPAFAALRQALTDGAAAYFDREPSRQAGGGAISRG